MSTITLPNIRVSSDLTVGLKLKDGGVAIDWSTLSNIRVSIYADAQRSLAGRCTVAIDETDSTVLVCQYAANKPQYLGVNRVIVQCTYLGETKTYDKPAFNFVRWTDDQDGEEITITDPDIDVEIEVEDVSSSVLQEAIDAALNAAADAEEAAHLVPLQVLQDCVDATGTALDAAATANAAGIDEVSVTVDANVGTPSVDVSLADKHLTMGFHNVKGNTGDPAGFGTVTASVGANTGTPSVSVSASGPDTAKNISFAFDGLKGEKGDKGDQGNTGSSVDYPYELVNNLTTNDATKGLTAAMGKTLEDEVSQLDLKVNDTEINYTPGKYLNGQNTEVVSATDGYTDYVPYNEGETVLWKFAGSTQNYKILFYDKDKAFISGSDFGAGYSSSDGGKIVTASQILRWAPGACYLRAGFTLNYADAAIIINGEKRWEPHKGLEGLADYANKLNEDVFGLHNDIADIHQENERSYVNSSLNRPNVELGHIVDSDDWEYKQSTTFDAGWVVILGEGTMRLFGATPGRVVFYNSTTPTSSNYLGNVSSNLDGRIAIPFGAKLAIVNFDKSVNTNGYADFRVEQDFSSTTAIDNNSISNRPNVLVSYAIDTSDWVYRYSTTLDSTQVKILGTGTLKISGATVLRVIFYNSEKPSASSYISNTQTQESAIPSGAVLAVVNFRKSENTNGYDNLIVSQDYSCLNNKTFKEKEEEFEKGYIPISLNKARVELSHVAQSSDWEYVTTSNFDAGLVKILGGGLLKIENGVPSRIVFYNSETPSSSTYISNVQNTTIAEIPQNAVLAIINFPKSDNSNGYDNLRVYQSYSAALNKDIKTNKINVLTFGSSFGVNTVIQFPYFCKSAGIDATVGNLYRGSATLSDIVDIINGTKSWEKGSIITPANARWISTSTDFVSMLTREKWDVVVINRGASERRAWTNDMVGHLQTIIEYIKANVNGTPRIIFNPTFAAPVFSTTKTSQLAETEEINETALEMQAQFGFEIMPVATAVQNARMTNLIGFGSVSETIPDLAEDDLHLDTGVGSYVASALMFEYLCGEHFNKSILANGYVPVSSDITAMNVFNAASFTAPTTENMKVAKYCVLSAMRKPFEINTAIGELYPYES